MHVCGGEVHEVISQSATGVADGFRLPRICKKLQRSDEHRGQRMHLHFWFMV